MNFPDLGLSRSMTLSDLMWSVVSEGMTLSDHCDSLDLGKDACQ